MGKLTPEIAPIDVVIDEIDEVCKRESASDYRRIATALREGLYIIKDLLQNGRPVLAEKMAEKVISIVDEHFTCPQCGNVLDPFGDCGWCNSSNT